MSVEGDNSDDTMIVTLKVRELRAIVREEVAAAIKSVLEPNPVRWADVEMAATHCGVSGATIRKWIARGAPAVHLGRDYRMRLIELDAWLEKHPAITQLIERRAHQAERAAPMGISLTAPKRERVGRKYSNA